MYKKAKKPPTRIGITQYSAPAYEDVPKITINSGETSIIDDTNKATITAYCVARFSILPISPI